MLGAVTGTSESFPSPLQLHTMGMETPNVHELQLDDTSMSTGPETLGRGVLDGAGVGEIELFACPFILG